MINNFTLLFFYRFKKSFYFNIFYIKPIYNFKEMSEVGCPSHPNARLVEDHRAGDLICTQCGLVVGERF